MRLVGLARVADILGLCAVCLAVLHRCVAHHSVRSQDESVLTGSALAHHDLIPCAAVLNTFVAFIDSFLIIESESSAAVRTIACHIVCLAVQGLRKTALGTRCDLATRARRAVTRCGGTVSGAMRDVLVTYIGALRVSRLARLAYAHAAGILG